MKPHQSRPVLLELLYVLDRATRLYRSSLVDFPADIDDRGWTKLGDLTERTAEQTRVVLEHCETTRGRDLELGFPAPFITRSLADKIRARRAIQTPRPRRPGMDLH